MTARGPRSRAAPTDDGGKQDPSNAAQTWSRHRTTMEITVDLHDAYGGAPPQLARNPPTVGVGPLNEPAVTPPASPAPATVANCRLHRKPTSRAMSAPVDGNQSSLSEDGWQNEIASVQIKSGTWDFYSDEDFAGEMMRLGAGSYPRSTRMEQTHRLVHVFRPQ